MAEVLVSPGVLARENDQTFLEAQPVQAGAAIVGPTVKGPVGIPTLVTTYSEYLNTCRAPEIAAPANVFTGPADNAFTLIFCYASPTAISFVS